MKFHKNSALRLKFLRKSASRRSGEFRRSAEKLLEFRIPQRIFFKFRCSASPDDPHLQQSLPRTMSLKKAFVSLSCITLARRERKSWHNKPHISLADIVNELLAFEIEVMFQRVMLEDVVEAVSKRWCGDLIFGIQMDLKIL